MHVSDVSFILILFNVLFDRVYTHRHTNTQTHKHTNTHKKATRYRYRFRTVLPVATTKLNKNSVDTKRRIPAEATKSNEQGSMRTATLATKLPMWN